MSDFTELDRFPSGDDETADLMVLERLQQHGADLSKKTEVIHYLYFDDEASARAAAEQLAELGYTSQGRPSESSFLLMAERDEVPSIENVCRMRQVMETAADRFGGEYDGWEAAVTK
jgi:Regulator of ribonuclease activity B